MLNMLTAHESRKGFVHVIAAVAAIPPGSPDRPLAELIDRCWRAEDRLMRGDWIYEEIERRAKRRGGKVALAQAWDTRRYNRVCDIRDAAGDEQLALLARIVATEAQTIQGVAAKLALVAPESAPDVPEAEILDRLDASVQRDIYRLAGSGPIQPAANAA